MADAKARYLGLELRRLREGTGINGDSVAAKLKWSPSKVSRYERARTALRPREVERMLDLYKTPDPKRGELLALAEKVYRTRTTQADYRDPMADEYDEAREVLDWALLHFPRVLQTSDYALETLTATRDVLQTLRSEITVSVGTVLGWQHRLIRRNGLPLGLRAVFDESCLYRQLGTPAVMRAQLEHVIELAGQESANVRMLPYTAGAAGRTVPFTYLRYHEVGGYELPDSVMLADLHGARLVEVEREVYHYGLAFEALWKDAADAAETLDALRLALMQAWADGPAEVPKAVARA